MIRLHNRIQPYSWGSRTAIAAMQGRAVPSPGPEAELWLGAHEVAPSTVVGVDGEVTLAALIADDPDRMLGPAVVSRFGARLPYLLKVIAAAEPLSLQAHPDAAQAAAGLAAEEASGSSVRSFRDMHHKPELMVAIDEFEALCGFRDPAVTAPLLATFGVAALGPVVDALKAATPADGLRDAVTILLEWPPATRADLVAAVAAAGAALVQGIPTEPPMPDDALRRAQALAVDLGRRYPADIGVVVALMLNHVRLQPGEAVFMPAGNLHAYLRGVGVEVMAASDNVLRGGLTVKPVDAPGLLRVLRYEVLADPVVSAVPLAPGLVTWPAPVTEFALHRACPRTGAPVVLPGSGPRILICVRGTAELCDEGGTGGPTRLHQGESVFLAPGEGPVTARGDADLFQASPHT